MIIDRARVEGFVKHRVLNKPRKLRYLISAAGFPNYGDEFITREWLRYLAKVEPYSEVWLDCNDSTHAAHLFGNIHGNLHFTSTAWNVRRIAYERSSSFEEGLELVRSYLENLGTPREDLGIYKLLAADSIHLLGGGYINETWPLNLYLADIARFAKERHGITAYCTGLGVAPCSESWLQVLKKSLSCFDHVSVRDVESARMLGIECGVDDAFLAFGDTDTSWQRIMDGARAFVCLQQDVSGRHPEAVDLAVKVLRESCVAEDEPLELVEAIPPEDGWSLDLFRERWRGEVRLMPFSELWLQGFPFADNAVWVTSRFHMHLLGAASGAIGCYLDLGSSYYDVKHGSLAMLGTGWTKLSLGDEAGSIHAAAHNPSFAEAARVFAKQKLAEVAPLYGDV